MAWSASGAQYYVDFGSGSDAANGLTTGTAWKHSPDDANATGNPHSTVLAAGDTIFFKGGVSYNGTIASARNGTPSNPITFQGYSSWGTQSSTNTGNGTVVNYGAIMEGTVSGVTNLYAFDCFGNNQVITGFEIRNSTNGIFTDGDNTIISNNVIHHIGTFPYDTSQGFSAGGQATYFSFCNNGILVSNLMFDINDYAASGNGYTNITVWGNDVSGCQNHGFQLGTAATNPTNGINYVNFSFNFVHDETNGFNHSDGIQIFNSTIGSICIVAGNRFRDCVDSVNMEADNAGQPSYNLYPSGDWYMFNNVTWNTQPGLTGLLGYANGSQIDCFNGVPHLYVFNNTFVDHNAGWGGYRFSTRDPSVYLTNVFLFNNLYYNSLGGGLSNSFSPMISFHSGWNAFTNYWRNNVTVSGDPTAGANPVTLAQFQTDAPGFEVMSVAGPVIFANYSYSGGVTSGWDFHAQPGSISIGRGTNLSVLVPNSTFSFLPTRYAVSAIVDATGIARGSIWDIGAYQGQTATGPMVMRVTNMRVTGIKIGQ